MKLSRVVRYSLAWLGFVAMGYALTLMFTDRVADDDANTSSAIVPPAGDDRGVDVNTIDIALAVLGGGEQRLSAWQGKPLVVNFWATWCAPCRREIPLLKTLQDEYAADELTVIGVAIDEMDAVQIYAEDAQFNYPVLVGEDSGFRMASAIGVQNFYVPITAFVDRSGRVTRIHTGEVHREDAELAIREIVAR
jgi:thiol-disulfide isomerase/thioredoxin